METIIGDAFIWLVGNRDLLYLLGAFTLGIGIIHSAFSLWHFVERGRE